MDRAITTTYEDVRPLLIKECSRWSAIHGGDFDDLLSEANEHFVTAYHAYDSSIAKFSTFLVTVVRRGFNTVSRTLAHRAAVRGERVPEDAVLTPTASGPFDRREFLEGLSSDGREAVLIVLEADDETLSDIAATPTNTYGYWRKLIRQTLKDRGWPASRIRAAFEEVRQYFAILSTEETD